MTPLSEGSRLATVKIHFLPSPCNFTTGFLLPPPPPPPRPRLREHESDQARPLRPILILISSIRHVPLCRA